jgi:hypothetical protein
MARGSVGRVHGGTVSRSRAVARPLDPDGPLPSETGEDGSDAIRKWIVPSSVKHGSLVVVAVALGCARPPQAPSAPWTCPDPSHAETIDAMPRSGHGEALDTEMRLLFHAIAEAENLARLLELEMGRACDAAVAALDAVAADVGAPRSPSGERVTAAGRCNRFIASKAAAKSRVNAGRVTFHAVPTRHGFSTTMAERCLAGCGPTARDGTPGARCDPAAQRPDGLCESLPRLSGVTSACRALCEIRVGADDANVSGTWRVEFSSPNAASMSLAAVLERHGPGLIRSREAASRALGIHGSVMEAVQGLQAHLARADAPPPMRGCVAPWWVRARDTGERLRALAGAFGLPEPG